MLSQKQIDFLHANGYLIMRGVVQGKELELLKNAVNRVQSAGLAYEGKNHEYRRNADGTESYWRTDFVWEWDDVFEAVTMNPELLENIGQCIGHPFFPFDDALVVKLANSGAIVPWHQDPPYYKNPTVESTYDIPHFTTDIYLDYSGPENGCVWAIHEHHLVGHVDLKSRSEDELYEHYGAVPLVMEPGDVMFHCLSTPHGSKPNTSNMQRRIFYLFYTANEVYRDVYSPDHLNNDRKDWDISWKQKVESMLQKRTALGLELPTARNTLAFGEKGIEFVGNPITPPRHWGTLIREMAQEEITAKKRLDKAVTKRL